LPGAWLAAALAVLAALAVGLVAGSRSGRVPAAAPIDGPAPLPGAVGASAVAPAPTPLTEPLMAMPRDEAIALVRRAFDALNAGDVDTAARLMHPDVTWPRGPEGGALQGRDEFRAHWAERLSNVSIYLEPIDFVFAEDDLVVTTHEIVRRRSTDEWYGEYRTERRFSFRDGLIAAMTRGRSGSRSG
jgi:ketosteroid isomerase-like protein